MLHNPPRPPLRAPWTAQPALDPLFTAGQVLICERYGRKDVAAAMRRLNAEWRPVEAAGDWARCADLALQAELLIELAYVAEAPV